MLGTDLLAAMEIPKQVLRIANDAIKPAFVRKLTLADTNDDNCSGE
jgi:hypothetical protein